MIVVDTNVLVPLAVAGARTSASERVAEADPIWLVPPLWRSELQNVLVGYCRRGTVDWPQARSALDRIGAAVGEVVDVVRSDLVLLLAEHTRLSAYDAEFGVLAEVLDLPLLTWDGALLGALPHRALTPEAFLALG